MVVCVRGDGYRLGLFWIDHKRKGEKPKPWQHLISRSDRVAGMNLNMMREWSQYALQHMKRGDILILDRLSSHLNKNIKTMFEEKGVQFLFLPPKAAILLSPLDRGFFGEFTKLYRERILMSPEWKKDVKFQLAVQIHNQIPSDHIKSFFKNCGLTSVASISTIKNNFKKEMKNTDFEENLS